MRANDSCGSHDDVAKRVARAKREIGSMKELLGRELHAGDDAESGEHGAGAMTSVRQAMHRGKRIVVRTHYEVTVDGESLGAHLGVANDGSVHYHGLPNYAFASMLDLVRRVIDASGQELPDDEIRAMHHKES